MQIRAKLIFFSASASSGETTETSSAVWRENHDLRQAGNRRCLHCIAFGKFKVVFSLSQIDIIPCTELQHLTITSLHRYK